MSPGGELPVGTVTFLFTDIEGSTRLLKQLRDRYGEALDEHQRILRKTFEEHDGHEIDTQGDSFFVAFRRAKDAVAAAVDGQRRLARHAWPAGAELRVRMGLHTGEPAASGERYVGLGVHRAARISAAGHGGQVLVSQATRELLRDDPLQDVTLRDLGEHQLKDLDEPERLYQLVAPGLCETFPPLKTAAPAPFEGREGELAEAAAEQMAAPWRRPGRRTLIAATFGAAVIGVVAGVLLTQGGGSTASASVEPNSVGVINPTTGRVSATASVGTAPGGVATGAGAIWVANTDDDTVSRIDASTNQVDQKIQVGGGPAGVAVGGRFVWVTNGLDATVSRIDTTSDQAVGRRIPVGNGPVGIAYGAKRIWVANSVDGTVSEIDPLSGKVARTLPAVPGATGILVAFGRVWVVSPSAGTVVSLDPKSGQIVDQVPVGVDPVAIAAGDGAIWVANRDGNSVSKIAPQPSAAQVDVIQVGHGPVAIATAQRDVWVANGGDGTLSRIDAATDQVTRIVDLRNPPQALAATEAGIYVAVRSSGLEHRGGTLRVRTGAPDFLDPALAYSGQAWSILSMTNDGLVGFRRVGGIEGVQLVPDLAVALPTPTDGGATYAFRVRRDVRYSTGEVVQPGDFRAAIERLFEARPASAGIQYFSGLVGADRCRPGHACDLSRGIVVDDAQRTVTFHLTAPDGDFLSKLALPFADAVPARTPAPKGASHDHALPATGAYLIKEYRRSRSLTLVRNPHFREWSVDAQPAGYPERLSFDFSNDPNSMPDILAVEHGQADVAPAAGAPPLPSQQLATLATRYSSQLRLTPSTATNFFFLNTRVSPFDNLRVRQAVNYAFDRRAFIRALGPGRGVPACQILPPNYPSYRRTCPYGVGGVAGVERARNLVKSADEAGARVTVWVPSPAASQGRFMVNLLSEIGLHAHLKTIGLKAAVPYFGQILDPRNHVQMGFDGWLADFPSDAGFLPPLFSCASFSTDLRRNGDPSEFCDHAVDRLFARAQAVQAENPGAAPPLWQAAERAILRQAPLVPTFNPEAVAFLAPHVGNFQYHPQWGVLLDQLWLK